MIPVARPCTDEREVAAATEVIRSGMLAQGPWVDRFEREFARYCDVEHAIAINTGTAALHTALLACGIGPGDEVIVPSFSFFATASCVSMCGAKPVFVDVDRKTFTIDPEGIARALSPQTRAVIGVHLFGQPFDVHTVREICDDNGLILIEDGAQAHGAEYQGKKVGGFGDAACFSFYPTKNMTVGEGGMVTTHNPDIAQKVRLLINHGQSDKYVHTILGYNFRMTDISGAIGCVQLSKLDGFNKRRIENARYFHDHITAQWIQAPVTAPGCSHVYHQYVIQVMDDSPISRDDLARFLHDHGIGTAIHYPIPIHKQPVYRNIAVYCHCQNAEDLCSRILSLPVHPLITTEERKMICTTINGMI
jgi:perosamine synthetase